MRVNRVGERRSIAFRAGSTSQAVPEPGQVRALMPDNEQECNPLTVAFVSSAGLRCAAAGGYIEGRNRRFRSRIVNNIALHGS